MSFKHLKAGDQVYIVPQSTRYNKSEPYYANVHKVGKKYGYILRYSREAPFDLVAGQSVHQDCNAHANGHGFDVYLSKEAYQAHVATAEANARLLKRLKALQRSEYSQALDYASPKLVAELHAVLDRHGI